MSRLLSAGRCPLLVKTLPHRIRECHDKRSSATSVNSLTTQFHILKCSLSQFQEGIDATGSSPEITRAELQHDQDDQPLAAKEPYTDDDDDGSGVEPDESSGSGWGAGPGPDDEDGRGSGDSGRLLIEIPEDDEDFTPRHQITYAATSSTPSPVYSATPEPVQPVEPAQPEELPTPPPTTTELLIPKIRLFNLDIREQWLKHARFYLHIILFQLLED